MLCSIGGVERGPRRRELAATAISCLPSRQSAIFHEPPYRPAMMALWMATKDNSLQGPKHSINVLSDVIMLYKAGASGRSLGAIDKFGTPQLNALLASAAEEFGQLMQEASV
jgi:hypothetical protein